MQSSLKNITCDLTKNRMIDHSGVHCANPIIFLIKILFVRHVFSNCNVSPSSGLSLALLALSFIGFLEQNTFIAFFFLFANLIPKSDTFFIFPSYFDTVINIISSPDLQNFISMLYIQFTLYITHKINQKYYL